MKKLSTLFSITVLSTTLALAGCKKSRDQENKDPGAPAPAPAQKTTDTPAPATPPAGTTPAATAPTADTPKTDDKAAAPATAGAPSTTDLPPECTEYKATVDKLQSCDKLDAKTREAAKADLDKATALASKSKDEAVKMCKSNNESLTKLGQTNCAWK